MGRGGDKRRRGEKTGGDRRGVKEWGQRTALRLSISTWLRLSVHRVASRWHHSCFERLQGRLGGSVAGDL